MSSSPLWPLLICLHVFGIWSAGHAIMNARTPKAAIAWAVCLVQLPYITIPLYWIFGTSRFKGYAALRRAGSPAIQSTLEQILGKLEQYSVFPPRSGRSVYFENRLIGLPVTRGNDVVLLPNVRRAFDTMLATIDAAEDYILVQFFIIRDDEIGREFLEHLCSKAAEGVRVYVLYDEIGCLKLTDRYVRELKKAGVVARVFQTSRRGKRFQINFRNHRKIVVVDGRTAFTGGLNVGDEYLGKNPKYGAWRDTHVQVQGPAVQCIQIPFVEDWYWATMSIPEICWDPVAAPHRDIHLFTVPTGPADDLDNCRLFLMHAFNAAEKRLWISSPYFVPDEALAASLRLTALRGVDVRIILPEKPDHLLVYLSTFSYLEDMMSAGVKFYRYRSGFLHQKAMLIDDTVAAVGSVNLDNRSVHLNFELMLFAEDRDFAGEVEQMLSGDLSRSRVVPLTDYTDRSVWFRISVHVARLFDPIQ